MTEKTYTDVDLGIKAPASSGEKTYTEAQITGIKPEGERGVLSNAPDDTTMSSLAKGTGTAVIKGLAHIPGFAGDIKSLGDAIFAGMQTGANKLVGGNKTFADYMAENKKLKQDFEEATKNSLIPKIPEPPSGADISNPILEKTGEYKPSSLPAKVGMAGVEGVLGALSPASGVPALGVTGGNALKEVVSTLPSALTGSMAGEAVNEYAPNLAIPAAIVTGAGTNLATQAGREVLRNRSAAGQAANAEKIAGQIARESATDPTKAMQSIDTVDGLPNVAHTAAEATQDQGIAALERKLAAISQKETGGEENALLAAQKEKGQETLQTAAEKASQQAAGNVTNPDVQGSYGIQGTKPATEASISARDIYSNFEEAANQGVKDAWNAKDLTGATLYQRKALSGVQRAVNAIKSDPVYGDAMPSWVDNALSKIADTSSRNGQVAIDSLQDLRSRALKEKRRLDSALNPSASADAQSYALGKVAEAAGNALSDEKNFSFSNTKARDAWSNAVKATRDYHDTFNSGSLSKLNVEKGAVPMVSPEATLATVLRGDNAAQNLSLFRKAVGNSADPLIGDYMVSQLTNNGQSVVKAKDVEKFLANNKNAQIVDAVPNLRDRLMSIAQVAGESEAQAANRQIADNFTRVVNQNDPKALTRFFDTHRDAIHSLFPDQQGKDFLNAIESSARRIGSIPQGGANSTKAMENLANGRIFDLVYGKAIGKLADTASGATAGAALSTVGVPASLAETAGAVIGATGSGGKGIKQSISNIGNNLMFGGTREEALNLLHQAMRDPKLLKELMQKPSPQKMSGLMDLAKVGGEKALQGSVVPAEQAAGDISENKGYAGGGSVHADHRVEKVKQHFMSLLQKDPEAALALVEHKRGDFLSKHPELKDKIDFIERHVRRAVATKKAS